MTLRSQICDNPCRAPGERLGSAPMRWVSLLLLLTGIVIPEITALFLTDYSPMTHYISELGQSGYATANPINFGAFLPTGLLCFALLFGAKNLLPSGRMLRGGLLICASVGVGYIIAALFPCLPGCPVPGMGRQAIHNMGGLIEYAGGALGLGIVTLALYRANAQIRARRTLLALALFTTGIVLLSTPNLIAHKGVFQRLADYSFFIWLVSIYWVPRHNRAT